MSATTILVVICTAIPSFCLGTLVSLYAGIQSHDGLMASTSGGDCSKEKMNDMILKSQQLQQLELEKQRKEMEANLPDCKEEKQESDIARKDKAVSSSSTESLFPSDGFGKHIVQMSSVDKTDFINTVDPGVPVDLPSKGANDVLILYTSNKALPTAKTSSSTVVGSGNPKLSMEDAVQNCNQLNVVLNDHSGGRQQCIAIVPQYESYHIQKWMRISKDKNVVDKSAIPLKLVSRGQVETGRDAFKPPPMDSTRQHWDLLKTFLKNIDDVLGDLKPILEKISRNKTVIVMVCNFGQSELLMNFVCAAKSRNIDISNVIVFTTDTETKDLAEGLGLSAYYDYRVSNKYIGSVLSYHFLIIPIHQNSPCSSLLFVYRPVYHIFVNIFLN